MTSPVIFREGQYTAEDIEKFKSSEKIWKIVENYNSQLEELFVTRHPELRNTPDYAEKLSAYQAERSGANRGNWVYYPWSGALIHLLTEEESFEVRTSRNKNIVTKEEQKKLYESTIGMLGLSIGNGMVVAMTYAGIGGALKIADYDTLELSNLNRIRSGLQNLGEKKTDITIQQVFEVNPYAEISVFEEGVSNANLEKFVSGEPKPTVIFEAIDDFEMKIRVRMLAKDAGVPVIMLTNLGDRLLIDIERYDLDKRTKLFNGLIGGTAEEILNNPVTDEDKRKYAINLVGKENIPPKVVESVMEVNKTLAGRPQLMSTVTIGSGVAAYLARKLILGEELPSGRTLIDFSKQI